MRYVLVNRTPQQIHSVGERNILTSFCVKCDGRRLRADILFISPGGRGGRRAVMAPGGRAATALGIW